MTIIYKQAQPNLNTTPKPVVTDHRDNWGYFQPVYDWDKLWPEILREIGNALNGVVNRVSLSGHTDSTPFAGGNQGIGNWELSASRANASRRELIAGGMQEDKTLRVVGLAAAVPWDKQDPYSPINRRISIIVMNKKTEDTILRDGKEGDAELPAELRSPAVPAMVPGGAATETKPPGH